MVAEEDWCSPPVWRRNRQASWPAISQSLEMEPVSSEQVSNTRQARTVSRNIGVKASPFLVCSFGANDPRLKKLARYAHSVAALSTIGRAKMIPLLTDAIQAHGGLERPSRSHRNDREWWQALGIEGCQSGPKSPDAADRPAPTVRFRGAFREDRPAH
jgi:hypothetical protein